MTTTTKVEVPVDVAAVAVWITTKGGGVLEAVTVTVESTGGGRGARDGETGAGTGVGAGVGIVGSGVGVDDELDEGDVVVEVKKAVPGVGMSVMGVMPPMKQAAARAPRNRVSAASAPRSARRGLTVVLIDQSCPWGLIARALCAGLCQESVGRQAESNLTNPGVPWSCHHRSKAVC